MAIFRDIINATIGSYVQYKTTAGKKSSYKVGNARPADYAGPWSNFIESESRLGLGKPRNQLGPPTPYMSTSGTIKVYQGTHGPSRAADFSRALTTAEMAFYNTAKNAGKVFTALKNTIPKIDEGVNVANGTIPTAIKTSEVGTVTAQASLPKPVIDNPAAIQTSPSDVIVRSSEIKAAQAVAQAGILGGGNMKTIGIVAGGLVLLGIIFGRNK